jgi:hypothetical protein
VRGLKTGLRNDKKRFGPLLEARRIETLFSRADLNRACLLCSEASADHCHRSLVAAYLFSKRGSVKRKTAYLAAVIRGYSQDVQPLADFFEACVEDRLRELEA